MRRASNQAISGSNSVINSNNSLIRFVDSSSTNRTLLIA